MNGIWIDTYIQILFCWCWVCFGRILKVKPMMAWMIWRSTWGKRLCVPWERPSCLHPRCPENIVSMLSTWFSFRMYKLLGLFFFFLFVCYILKGVLIRKLICYLVCYGNCKNNLCYIHIFKMSRRVQRFQVNKFKIVPNSFIWEMIAWAVVVSNAWTLWTIEENQYTPVTF